MTPEAAKFERVAAADLGQQHAMKCRVPIGARHGQIAHADDRRNTLLPPIHADLIIASIMVIAA